MTPRFDLVDIAQVLYQRRRLLVWITLLAAALGAVGYLIQKKKYQAKSEVVVANPLYADRNHFFRTNTDRYIDYFAGEDDIDRIMAIANSDEVKNRVVEKAGLFQHYKLDTTSKKDELVLGARWKKSFKVVRTEYKNIEVMFTDEDPEKAAEVVNEAIKVIERTYRNFYISIKDQMYEALYDKLLEADSLVVLFTDSLVALREEYQIYDILNPARMNTIVNTLKSNGHKEFGRGVEEIQNVSSIKDRWVMDRSTYVSLLNEFSTGTRPGELSFINVISPATPPIKPAGLNLTLTSVACGLAGFFAAMIIVLLNAYFRVLLAARR